MAMSIHIAVDDLGSIAGAPLLGSGLVHPAIELLGAGLCLSRSRLVARDGIAWLLIGLAVASYATGDVLWFAWIGTRASPAFPSVADAFWLAFYALAAAGIAMLVSRSVRQRQRTLWLDGAIGGLAVAAAGLPPILAQGLGFAGSSTQAVAVNVSYPILDVSLLAVVVAAFALTGWRPGTMWIVLAGGLSLLAVADIRFLTAPTVEMVDTAVRPIYTVSMLLVGLAAWCSTGDAVEVDMRSLRVMLVPTVFSLLAAGVLAYGAVRHVPVFAIGLALAALAAVPLRTVITVREIQALSHAHAAALRDELTGLGNRQLLYEQVERQIEVAGASQPMALLLLDLDSFKDLNDVLGHDVGDGVLIEVAARLQETIHPGDVIVRMGGDEFAILVQRSANPAAARATAARIRASLERSFVLDGIELHIAASVGAAVYPDHGHDAHTLLRHADIAMYDAKSHGDTYRVYRGEPDDAAASRSRLILVEELRRAIANDEIEVHYQPKASMASGLITGVEALVRWRHPTRGLLAPETFLAVAHRIGVMRSITRVVLDRALSDCARWRGRGHDVSVAVNLSTVDLLHPDLALEMSSLLREHGVPAHALVVEVTEEVVMSDPIRSQAVIERLADEGITIALDDFGTGYSSLARLARLPVDELKIDRSFVARMTTDAGYAAIVRSTIHLAHELGLNVVAEGIEHQEQWDSLGALGCDEAQGYLLAMPRPASELDHLLEREYRQAA
jgi:diguanylate cyclase (GGDEF)-like protein